MTPGSFVLALMLVSFTPTQAAAPAADDRAAIVQTLLDYAEGYFGGEPARMTRAVSPYLTKREAMVREGAPMLLGEMNADTLIEYSYGVKLPPDARKITTEVLDVGTDTASARVFTARFNDYVHLVKRNGAWQIVNVLWHSPPVTPAGDQTAAANEAVRAFAAGLIAVAGGGTLPSLHPMAHLRTLAPGRQGRPRYLVDQNAGALIAGLARGAGKLPGVLEEMKIAVEGIDNDIAAARILAGGTRLHLHLLRQDGQWRVVNVLRSVEPAVQAGGRRF